MRIERQYISIFSTTPVSIFTGQPRILSVSPPSNAGYPKPPGEIVYTIYTSGYIFYTNGYTLTVPLFLSFSQKSTFPARFSHAIKNFRLSQWRIVCFGVSGHRGCSTFQQKKPSDKEVFTMNTMIFTTTVLIAIGIVLALFRIWNS
jgi:hypothetical protein